MMTINSEYSSRGWQVGMDLKHALGGLLERQMMCDVTFEVSEGEDRPKIIGAHKNILSARSPVFEAMFEGEFVENAENTVKITDATGDNYMEMLRYIYTDDASLTGSNVIRIMNLADKYFLEGLKTKCRDFLTNNTTLDNVCDILNECVFFKHKPIIEDSLKYIWENIAQILSSVHFESLSPGALLRILQCERRGRIPEKEIIDACLKWANTVVAKGNAETVRSALGECLKKIKFAFLQTNQFVNTVNVLDFLTGEEKYLFTFFIVCRDPQYKEQLENLGFNMASETFTLIMGNWTSNYNCPRQSQYNPHNNYYQQNTSYKESHRSVSLQLNGIGTASVDEIAVYLNTTKTVAGISIRNNNDGSVKEFNNQLEQHAANEPVAIPIGMMLVAGQSYTLSVNHSNFSLFQTKNCTISPYSGLSFTISSGSSCGYSCGYIAQVKISV